MQPWKRVEPTVVTQVAWRQFVEKSYVRPDGKVMSFTTVGIEGSHSVAIIAITKNNKIVIAQQFRPGPEMIFDELPGGGVEDGEALTNAARRELLEETGYASNDEIVHLGNVCRDAYSNNSNSYYLLKNCEKIAETTNEEGEFTEPVEISIDQLFENAKNFKMSDTPAVLLAYDVLMELKEHPIL